MIGFFRFTLVLLLLVVVAMLSAITTMHFAIHGAEVAIPDFKGMTVADAGQKAASAGLSFSVQNRLYSTEIPIGRVVSQTPAAGAVVRHGWRVWLTESLGPQKLAIPDLRGKDQRVAAIEVRRAGLQTGMVAEIPWPGAAPGAVISQSPEAEASGVERPVINLLVAAPQSVSQPPALVMPDLEGQIFTAAALALTHAGLHLAPVQEQAVNIPSPGSAGPSQPSAPPGAVVAQNPPPGARVDASTSIELTVAK
jgi:eukaryotic-like serine/threonine-protein kinase